MRLFFSNSTVIHHCNCLHIFLWEIFFKTRSSKPSSNNTWHSEPTTQWVHRESVRNSVLERKNAGKTWRFDEEGQSKNILFEGVVIVATLTSVNWWWQMARYFISRISHTPGWWYLAKLSWPVSNRTQPSSWGPVLLLFQCCRPFNDASLVGLLGVSFPTT